MKKVGLALGGGGARGCAHIGVIKALREADIPVDFVAGTSIGAVMGGVLALGKIEEVEKILKNVKWQDVVKHFDPTIPKKGLFQGKKVVKLIEKIIGKKTFSDTQIPFVAVATDLVSGKEVDLESGSMIDAMRASIAIPGIITPFKKKGRHLIDGGVTNPLPTDIVRDLGAEVVISVDLNSSFLKERRYTGRQLTKYKLVNWLTPSRPNIIDVIESSVFAMQNQLTQTNLEIHQPDFLIQPDLGDAGIFDFQKAKKLISEGYKETKKQIRKIKKAVHG